MDRDADPLNHFAKGGEPKVNAFWSVTMYNLKYNLGANPINRYSMGDRSGMKPDADGGQMIYVQKDSPGADKESIGCLRRTDSFPGPSPLPAGGRHREPDLAASGHNARPQLITLWQRPG